MKFIDLFAGLGGFHQALASLGHQCVFASEIDPLLSNIYQSNFGILPNGDIRDIPINTIPSHDILCAGFPCQPFSKAGEQQGFNCPRNGDLFDFVIKIIEYHKPSYIMLENVANIQQHNEGKTWTSIKNKLQSLGYHIAAKKLSPHRFGIPQIRERLFIVGSRESLDNFTWPIEQEQSNLSIRSILDYKPEEAKKLSEQVLRCLSTWQEFIDLVPPEEEILSPLWSMEFGATYPYEITTPYALGSKKLQHYKGSFGKTLSGKSEKEIFESLPSYARKETNKFPKWKIDFIKSNRSYYQKHKNWIDQWLPEIQKFPSSLQKLEWNCKGEKRTIWNYLIQFRASGVRIKRPTTSPTLISMTSTQVPIIAWEKRYMTPKECSRLQSMEGLSHLPPNQTRAFEALGNAVNVNIVKKVATVLLGDNSKSEQYIISSSHLPLTLPAFSYQRLPCIKR